MDGHQLRFARRLADEGLIVLCEQRDELTAALDAARRDPDNLTLVGGAQPGAAEERVAAAVARVGGIVDELVASAAARRPCAGCAGLGELPLQAGDADVLPSRSARRRYPRGAPGQTSGPPW